MPDILKQRDIGKHWGRFSLAASQVSVFVSLLTLGMVGINTYATVSNWLLQYGIYLRFWLFMGALLVLLGLAYLLSWKYLVASFYGSSTEQFWRQSKPLTDKLDEILKEIRENREK